MANSFKKMITGKIISRTDSGMFISLDDIHVKEGFNKREDDERTRLADDDLFSFLMAGGKVPPLEVTPRDDGGVWAVEGHRRRRCYVRCRDAGKPVDRIHIVPFVGSDIERLARVMTSNNQLPLTPLEQAAVIKELAAFNLSKSEIAKLVHKSLPTIEKLMTLGSANHDVQQSVRDGQVSVEVAAERVKQHGENAGKVLEQDKAVAAASGRKKVTRSVITPHLPVGKLRKLLSIIDAALDRNEQLAFTTDAFRELLDIIAEHRALGYHAPRDDEPELPL